MLDPPLDEDYVGEEPKKEEEVEVKPPSNGRRKRTRGKQPKPPPSYPALLANPRPTSKKKKNPFAVRGTPLFKLKSSNRVEAVI